MRSASTGKVASSHSLSTALASVSLACAIALVGLEQVEPLAFHVDVGFDRVSPQRQRVLRWVLGCGRLMSRTGANSTTSDI